MRNIYFIKMLLTFSLTGVLLKHDVYLHFVFRSPTMSSSRSSGKEDTEPFIRHGMSAPTMRYGKVTCAAFKGKGDSCWWRFKIYIISTPPEPVNVSSRSKNELIYMKYYNLNVNQNTNLQFTKLPLGLNSSQSHTFAHTREIQFKRWNSFNIPLCLSVRPSVKNEEEEPFHL